MAYYGVYYNGNHIGTYTESEIMTMIHCSREIPSFYAKEGTIYRGKYRFEEIPDESEIKSFKKEWTEARFKILGEKNENQGNEHG